MTRTVIIGAQGQLGSELAGRLAGSDMTALSRAELDIADCQAVNSALDRLHPECVINAAAYNLVDRAEDEPERALAVNALGPRNLAAWCTAHAARLVHVSTDYVFGLDQQRRMPYTENDSPGPISAYAVSKLAGEQLVLAAGEQHLVIRTCGLYGLNATQQKGNFVSTMLRLGRERGEVRVVDDQRCTPTSVPDLTDAVLSLIEQNASGLYHFTNAGSATWCEFAEEIFRLAGMTVRVTPITSQEFGAKARRPAYSVLDCTRLQSTLGRSPPDWHEALARHISMIDSNR
jgi:dTDP-4-dehydrorhamnose reductase